jgi:class 3 adenylate cyclase
MGLDIPTIGFVTICLGWIQACFMVILTHYVKQYPGVNDWALTNILFALGFSLLLLRDVLPPVLPSVVANPLLILGGGLLYRGSALFLNRPFYWPLVVLPALGLVAFLLLSFVFLDDSQNYRALGTSLTGWPVLWAAAYILLSASVQRRDRSVWLAGGTLAVYGTFLLVRIPLTLFVEPVRDAFAPNPVQSVTVLFLLFGSFLWTLGFILMITQRMIAELNGKNLEISLALQQADELLLNILPPVIAARMKRGERELADYFPDAIVLFADIVNFTMISQSITPAHLVSRLNTIFTEFDTLAQKYGLEKIKTIGDCYMAVSGLPVHRVDYAEQAAEMALDLQRTASRLSLDGQTPLRLRVGLHGGEVVAGVIGTTKFAYDLWGDTVNTASRMESHGEPGQIQCTSAVYERLRDQYEFQRRGEISVKGKGIVALYFLVGRKAAPVAPDPLLAEDIP